MSWWDSMKLRRRADKARAVGWINLAITGFVCAAAASEGLAVFVLGGAWAAMVMGIAYGAAHLIDKRADRVIGR